MPREASASVRCHAGLPVFALGSLVLATALAGCFETTDLDLFPDPVECEGGYVLPHPRIGDEFVYDVNQLPIPQGGGISGDALDSRYSELLGKPRTDKGGELHGWPPALLIVRVEEVPDRIAAGSDIAYRLTYSIQDGAGEVRVLEEYVGDDHLGRATVSFGQLPGGKEFGQGGAFVRNDLKGFPAALRTSPLWGANLTAQERIGWNGTGERVEPIFWASPPHIEAVKVFEPLEYTLSVAAIVPDMSSNRACCPSTHIDNPCQGLVYLDFGGPDYLRRFVAWSGPVFVHESSPVPVDGGWTDEDRNELSFELVNTTVGEGPSVATLLAGKPSDKQTTMGLDGFQSNPFGFNTSLIGAIAAAEEDEGVQRWMDFHPNAVLSGFSRVAAPPSDEPGPRIDTWDLVYVDPGDEGNQPSDDSLHVRVARHHPEDGEEGLIPLFPEDPPPEMRVTSHSYGAPPWHVAPRWPPEESAIGFDGMADFFERFLPETNVDYVTCDRGWRVCIAGSQFDDGWNVDPSDEVGLIADPERFGNWGLVAHLDAGVVAHGRVPVEALDT